MSTKTGISVDIMTALQNTWDEIRSRHPDVPEVVITIGEGAKSGGRLALGHFHPTAWLRGEEELPELFVGGEGMAHGPTEVLATLLHEAAHGMAKSRDIRDTSRQHRYHNEKFKALGEEMGLSLTKDPSIGWSPSTVRPEIAETYAAQIELLTVALTVHRRQFGKAAARPSNNNGTVLICGCMRKIRASKSVAEAGPITCGVCQQVFAAEETDNEDES